MFNFQREVDRLFNQFWSDLPTRTTPAGSSQSFQVNTTDDGWRVDIPLPGIDPKDVSLEVAGNNLTIRAEVPSTAKRTSRYEQTLMIPQFLDLEKLTASHRTWNAAPDASAGRRALPRRVQIETEEEQKQLAGAGARVTRASSSRGIVASDTSSRRRLRCLPHGTTRRAQS